MFRNRIVLLYEHSCCAPIKSTSFVVALISHKLREPARQKREGERQEDRDRERERETACTRVYQSNVIKLWQAFVVKSFSA